MPPKTTKPPRQTRAPHRKSRQGCNRCKALKSKCDEKRPSCSRCEARGVPCSGYGSVNVRWCYKHETQLHTQDQDGQAVFRRDSKDHEAGKTPAAAETGASGVNTPSAADTHSAASDMAQTTFLDHPEPFTFGNWGPDDDIVSRFDPQIPVFNGTPFNMDELPWSPFLQTPYPEPADTPQDASRAQGDLCFQDRNTRDNTPNQPPTRLQEINDLSSSLSNYFFQDVLSRYCTWDSHSNIMRVIINARWQSSGALYHTMQSMAASCLANELPCFTEIAKRERSLAFQFAQDQSNAGEDRLLATLLLGHTSCWVDPDDLVPDQFRELCMAMSSYRPSTSTSSTLSFIMEAMEYWTMMLTFITDTEKLVSGIPREMGPLPLNSLITPNPFTGISRGVISIFTETGRLIYKLQARLPDRFLRQADMHFLHGALHDADQLERRILTYSTLDASMITVLGDPQTEPTHFQILDEAFLYTSLLQLYRIFPDLLSRRYRPFNPQDILLPHPALHEPSRSERDEWLTNLALHILGMLQGIPDASRTRSIQSPILVALSSELRYSLAKVREEDGTPDPVGGGLSRIQRSIDIARARRFVTTRLSAYWHVLPLLKVKKYQTIVDHVWSILDAGGDYVHWADMLRHQHLRTILG